MIDHPKWQKEYWGDRCLRLSPIMRDLQEGEL